MSAIASRGSLCFIVFPGKFTAKVFCAFLNRLAARARRKVHVIVDRRPVHRSKVVKELLVGPDRQLRCTERSRCAGDVVEGRPLS